MSRGWKFQPRNMPKKLYKIILAGGIGYLIFTGGRAYEYNQAQKLINNTLENVIRTEYFIPLDDPDYSGEIANGECYTPTSINPLYEYIRAVREEVKT